MIIQGVPEYVDMLSEFYGGRSKTSQASISKNPEAFKGGIGESIFFK